MTPSRTKIFSCPDCSLRVSGSEKACPRCGKSFGPEVKLECPFCGTLVSPNMDSCPACQVNYHDFVERAEQRILEKALDRIAQEIDVLRIDADERSEGATEEEGRIERKTAAAEETEDAVCPVCDGLVSTSDEECPYCGAIFEMETSDESSLPEEHSYCPICGEFVDLDVTTCPSCGAEFELEEATSELHMHEPEEVIKKLHIVSRAKSIKSSGGLATGSRVEDMETSSGLSNGTSITNGTGIINGKSLINGRGQINGVHLVNGKGAVNGRDLVNGMGILNGSAGRRHYPTDGREKVPFYVRWQFIAVILAIVIIAPSVLHFTDTGDSAPYTVDGDFSDWDTRTMFSSTDTSTYPGTQEIEWSVDQRDDVVYLYARAADELMAGPEAERLVLFIDHDDSNSTGYLISETGADFMIEILGWNGSVRSSTLLEFCSDDDQLDWSQWSNARSVKSMVAQNQLEAMAAFPSHLNDSAKFILTAQIRQGIVCVSQPVATDGGLLIIEQRAASGISEDGILESGTSTRYMRLRFTCQGEGGTVEGVTPSLQGIPSSEPLEPFAIDVGEEYVMDVRVDSSTLTNGDFVSASVREDGVRSSFKYVQIIGCPVRAYAYDRPQSITIDGAFADWEGKTVDDVDSSVIQNPNVDIDEAGANTTGGYSYFFVGVRGDLCAGAYVPKACTSQVCVGGAITVPCRRTAEDFVRIYVDSDRSSATGMVMTVGQLTIGADQMVEVCGLCCRIMSVQAFLNVAGTWALVPVAIDAAKDDSRIEIGVLTEVVGGDDGFDFLVEATDWHGETDYASNRTMVPHSRLWAVDSSGTSQYATSLSYQRKLFYDGTNFWSFYFDGSDTVCSYSADGGETWTSRGAVFKTSGVRKVSIWYDSGNSVVYAVGDRESSTRYIYIQKGSVNSGSCTVTWAASDSTPTVSTEMMAEKNSFICRDTNGYLWIACTDLTKSSPQTKYQLESWQSDSVGDITAWTSRGELLPSAQTLDSDLCGSIVPAGTGSDVWAIFACDGKVFSKKRESGSWESSEQTIYSETGSQEENTFNAPPSVVVGNDNVVHVVYGDIYEEGGYSKPAVWYTRNVTGGTTWAANVDLDSSKPSDVGNKYPTISIDTATGDLYTFWVRTDTSGIPQTIMGKKKSEGGSWESISFGTQTSYPKHFLTSIYSVGGEAGICWLWTQNTTGTIEVFFDIIPEFGDVVVPALTILAIFVVVLGGRRRRCEGRPN